MGHLFDTNAFAIGDWAAPLARVLKAKNVIPTLHARTRILRGTGYRWVQYEPHGWREAAYWLAKPAVMAAGDDLHVGCFVERGLTGGGGTKDMRINAGWRWHGLMACLADDSLRADLSERMMGLPAATRRWRSWSDTSDHTGPYRDGESLGELEAAIDETPEGWLNVILGVRMDRAALAGPENAVLGSICNALVCASGIAELIDRATPRAQ